jgi:arabinogalactan oligomer/maltooligosaccharide transport system permease protein
MFKGKIAVLLKYTTVAFVSAILLMLTQSAFAHREYAISGFLAITIIAIAITFLTNISIPMKFFLPGMLFLFAFVLGPIIYTVVMSTFQYQTGNNVSKPEAIARIESNAVRANSDALTFDLVLGEDSGKNLEILASDSANKNYFISSKTVKTDLVAGDITINSDGVATAAPGFIPLTVDERATRDQELQNARFFYDNQGNFVTLEGATVGALKHQTMNFSAANDSFTDIASGAVYKDNKRGNYANLTNNQDILQPGWRSPVWFSHYAKLFTDPQIRKPLFKVFIWTLVFAFLTVLTQFALGLLVAIAMNRKIHGRRFYRSIIILPYAMPSIMSILIWGGMFDTEFGAINHLFGTHIAWFQNAMFARAAVIIVNLWLGFPYFYLICSGALQAIPVELSEAASIDGASAPQIFRKITLPLLLQIVSPLLVASFAFNFNNFNIIYLLTGGGPSDTLGGDIAGSTDILISYTYKIAFGTGNQNLGLASAISVVIFVIIASISLYGIRRSRVLDSFK